MKCGLEREVLGGCVLHLFLSRVYACGIVFLPGGCRALLYVVDSASEADSFLESESGGSSAQRSPSPLSAAGWTFGGHNTTEGCYSSGGI